jgi:hypothetical protein
MNKPSPARANSSLRQRLIEDMMMRGVSKTTRRYDIRIVAGFADFLGRSPVTATVEEVRRFQIRQSSLGMHAPAMNSTVAAPRFSFTHTLDRPDLARNLHHIPYPPKLPPVLALEEVESGLSEAPELVGERFHPSGTRFRYDRWPTHRGGGSDGRQAELRPDSGRYAAAHAGPP